MGATRPWGETEQDEGALRALQPSYWDGPGRFDLDATVGVLQQELHAVLPAAALAA